MLKTIMYKKKFFLNILNNSTYIQCLHFKNSHFLDLLFGDLLMIVLSSLLSIKTLIS